MMALLLQIFINVHIIVASTCWASGQVVLYTKNSGESQFPNVVNSHAILAEVAENPGLLANKICNLTKDDTNIVGIGAAVDDKSLYTLSTTATYLDIPIIGIGCRSLIYSDREVHPLFLRFATSEAKQAEVILSLLRRYALYRFALLGSRSSSTELFVEELRNLTRSSPVWDFVDYFTIKEDGEDVVNALRQLVIENIRVVIIHCTPEEAAVLFEIAKQTDVLSNGYALIATESVVTSNESILVRYPEGLISLMLQERGNVNDSFQDIKTLMTKALTTVNVSLNNIDCHEAVVSTGRSNNNGIVLYRELLETSFNGITGNVNFDQDGDLTDASYRILNLMADLKNNSSIQWKGVGQWDNGVLILDTLVWPGKKDRPFGIDTHSILVATNVEKPFLYYAETDSEDFDCVTGAMCIETTMDDDRLDISRTIHRLKTHVSEDNITTANRRCCLGLCVDLLNDISRDLEITYELYLVADKNHGALENGSWNGMVGDLLYGKADIAISSFSITLERSEVIDFTAPFFHSGFSALVAKKKRELTFGAFLAPLDGYVWMTIFMSAIVISFAITVFEWVSPYGLHPGGRNRKYIFGFPSALNITFAILFCHTVRTKPPKCMTSRTLLNMWGGFSVIFFASYTANLAAFLAGQMSYLQIDGIHDPKLRNPTGEINIGTVTGSSIQSYLARLNPGLDRFMDDFVQPSTEQAIQSLRNGDIDVFLYDSPIIDYRMSNDPDCKLVSVGSSFGEEGFGIGLPKGSTLKTPLSTILLQYEMDGRLEQLHRKWFDSIGCLKEDVLNPQTGGNDSSVTVKHVTGLIVMLILGILTGFLLLLCEFAMHKWGVPFLKRRPRNKRNFLVISQRIHNEVNSGTSQSSSSNMQNLVALLKNGEFRKMIHNE
ncbi:glutamate receptor ionotropic, NMDA 3A-like [Antedon mediterranea]|uniref:glutamate receptor ionotropic, NMDA 3A-like n=1 Tax=Antedon mediterranea TaxID=105859 RepID=UPI003AF8A3B1